MPIEPALAEALNLALVPIIWAGSGQRIFGPGLINCVLVQIDIRGRPFVPAILQGFEHKDPGCAMAPLFFDDHAHAVAMCLTTSAPMRGCVAIRLRWPEHANALQTLATTRLLWITADAFDAAYVGGAMVGIAANEAAEIAALLARCPVRQVAHA